MKYHMKRVVGDTLLTYEEMNTLLTQIEAVLNSRPLSSLSDDPEDLNALIPGHFLRRSALRTIPEPSFINKMFSPFSVAAHPPNARKFLGTLVEGVLATASCYV